MGVRSSEVWKTIGHCRGKRRGSTRQSRVEHDLDDLKREGYAHEVIDDQSSSFLSSRRERSVRGLRRRRSSRPAASLQPNSHLRRASIHDLFDSTRWVSHESSKGFVVVKRRSSSREGSVVSSETVFRSSIAWGRNGERKRDEVVSDSSWEDGDVGPTHLGDQSFG